MYSPEPLVGRANKAGEVTLNVLDGVELGSELLRQY